MEDSELLRQYAEDGSESAFSELVQRHIGFVYAAALRQTGGAIHRAEEITQTVFIALARKSRALSSRRQLAGWLYITTRYACAKLKRSEMRRQEREFEAFTMNETMSNADATADWERLRPVLDDAMHELNVDDRELILMRFFQRCRFADIGREFGLSEDAARMRVDRALGKLRHLLAKRQITSTSAALGVVLANQPAVAIPAALAATVTGAALTSTAVTTGGALATFLMNTKTSMAAAAAVVAVGFAMYEFREAKTARSEAAVVARERDALRAQLREVENRAAGAEARVTDLQRRALVGTMQGAAPFAMPSRAGGAGANLLGGGTLTLSSRTLTPEEIRTNNGLNVDTAYAALYRQLGWTDAHRDQFRNLMLDRQESGERLFKSAVAAARAQNPNMDRGIMLEIYEATHAQTQAEQQADVRRVFGDATAKSLEYYQETLPMRAIANQLATALFNSETPLTPAQSDRVVEVLARNARGPIGKVEIAALDSDVAVAQAEAAGLLNPTQAAELRRVAARVKEQSSAERARNIAPAPALQPAAK